MTGPEQHAATVRGALDRLSDDRHCVCGRVYTCDWCVEQEGLAALDELVALAGRADELQRRLQSCEGNLDLSVQTGKLLVEQREAAEARADELQRGRDEARREADQLRAALEQIADRTYPAVYVGTTADGTKIYGGSDDAARFARAALAGVQADTCEHDWKDMRNADIESGEWCPKCGAIRPGNVQADNKEGQP